MRSVRERPAGATVAVLFGAFLLGPLFGLKLGEHVAPDSELAQTLAFAAFLLAFVGGLLSWMGLGVLAVVFGALRNLFRRGVPAAADLRVDETLVPPGYRAFVVLSIVLPALAGLVGGVFSATPPLTVAGVYAAGGALYGGALWWLAHHGWLPFPEPQ